jgi:hypothetical protein
MVRIERNYRESDFDLASHLISLEAEPERATTGADYI